MYMKVYGTFALFTGVVMTVISAIVANMAIEGGAWIPFLATSAASWVAIMVTVVLIDNCFEVFGFSVAGVIWAALGVLVCWILSYNLEGPEQIIWVSYAVSLIAYVVSSFVQLAVEDIRSTPNIQRRSFKHSKLIPTR